MDFLLVLIELFASCYCWGATSENRLKIGVVQWRGSIFEFLRKRRRYPPIIFPRIDMLMNALQVFADSFIQIYFLTVRLSSTKALFYTETAVLRFWPPLRQRVLRFILKRVVDFLSALIGLSLLGLTVDALRANISSKSAISLQRIAGWSKISGRRGRSAPSILLLRNLG